VKRVKAMGYTHHVPVIGDSEDQAVPERRREQVLDRLERAETFRCELEDFHERGMNGYTKWHEHDRET
jgi:hypothetical protein